MKNWISRMCVGMFLVATAVAFASTSEASQLDPQDSQGLSSTLPAGSFEVGPGIIPDPSG